MEFEEEKKINKKIIEIREILLMNEKSLKEFCELSSSCEEFAILINKHHELSYSIQKVKQILSLTRSVFSLVLTFNGIHNFDREFALGQLKELKQLTHLRLDFSKSFFVGTSGSLSFSDYLCCFTNLTTFALKISLPQFVEQNYFVLLSFYQKMKNLKTLSLSFSDVYEKSKDRFYFAKDALVGIHYLEELESFLLDINLRSYERAQALEILSVEMLPLQQLKNLSLNCENVNQSDYQRLFTFLKQKNKLEKLTIFSSFYYHKDTNIFTGCRSEENFLQLSALKYLNFRLYDYEQDLLNVLEIISQKENLEDVKLDFQITTNYLIYFAKCQLNGELFAKIQSLSLLKIDFDLLGVDLIEFISGLKPLKKLKDLFIKCYLIKQMNQSQQSAKVDDLVQVISNLKTFEIQTFVLGNSILKEETLLAIQQAQFIENLKFQYDKNNFEDCSRILKIINNKINLTSLELSFGVDFQLYEDDLIQLLHDISQNSQLKQLILNFKLKDKISHAFMQAYENCINKLIYLSSLTLSLKSNMNCKIDHLGFLCILNGVSSLSKLENLDLQLEIETIKFDAMKQLFISINNNPNLKILRLKIPGQNCLSEQELQQLEKYIQFPSKIQVLDFQIQLITNFKNNEKLFEESSKLQNLTTLIFSTSSLIITNQDVIRFTSYLKNTKQLSYLSLNNDSFNLLSLFQLYLSIGTLDMIYYIQKFEQGTIAVSRKSYKIIQNKEQQGISSQGVDIQQQTSLKFKSKLLLSQEQLANKQFDCIPFVFGNLRMLTSLDLVLPKDNQLTYEAVAMIFTSFRSLLNVQELTLEIQPNNQIRNEGIALLIRILCSLPSLKKLNLHIQSENCGIDWSKAHEFYDLIGKLRSLDSLSICIESPEELGEAKYYTQPLLKNIGLLNNLTDFKINLETNNYQQIFVDLHEMFSNFTNNLRSITVYYRNISVQDEKLFLSSLLQLKRLQYLMLNEKTPLNGIQKCMRLVKQKGILKFIQSFLH